MPNCFQLISKATGQAERFVEVDEKMCKHFGVPCDPEQWHFYWYPTIMEWGIAMNRSFQKQLQDIEEGDYQTKEEQEAANHQREIILWLDQHYTADAWYQVGR